MSGMLRWSDQPPADGWRVSDILAVTAFLITPFALYLGPLTGIILVAASPNWRPWAKGVAAAGLVPIVLGACLMVALFVLPGIAPPGLAPLRDDGNIFRAEMLLPGSNGVPVLAGLLLLAVHRDAATGAFSPR